MIGGLCRYPGGKARLYDVLVARLPTSPTYVEPFVGGGGFALRYLAEHDVDRAILADANASVIDLWRMVRDEPGDLCRRVRRFVPSTSAFYAYRDALTGGEIDGFKELVLHQISYSGLGAVSGGPLGGDAQKSRYGIGCRWSPEHLCRRIVAASKLLNRTLVALLAADFDVAIASVDGAASVYLDPPYYEMGDALYLRGLAREDHERLAKTLRRLSRRVQWLLSYDDAPAIHELYDWAAIHRVAATHVMAHKGRRQELMICRAS